MWRRWTSQAAFDSWHVTVIDGLGLPRIGSNQATGQPVPASQQTVRYTLVQQVAPDDWRAVVEPDVAARFAHGLGDLCDAPDPDPEMPEEML